MKLYEIKDNYLALMNLSDEIPPEALADTLESINGELKEKAVNIVHVIKNMDTVVIDTEIKRLQAMKNRVTERKKWLVNYLRDNMVYCGIERIESDLINISLRKAPKIVSIDDSDLIPDSYKETVTEVKIDKNVLKRELKAGTSIPGCSLIDGKRGLQIR